MPDGPHTGPDWWRHAWDCPTGSRQVGDARPPCKCGLSQFRASLDVLADIPAETVADIFDASPPLVRTCGECGQVAAINKPCPECSALPLSAEAGDTDG
jgi:hypothetical protein